MNPVAAELGHVPGGLRARLRVYRRVDPVRTGWQLGSTSAAYALAWVLAYFTLRHALWLMPLAVLLAAGFAIRLFLLMHDCGHRSLFHSPRVNDAAGTMIGYVVFFPFRFWQHYHAIHHAVAGDLDRPDGDVPFTMSVADYRRATPWNRRAYLLVRHPAVMFGFAFLYFLVIVRFPQSDSPPDVRRNIHATTLVMAVTVAAASLLIGFQTYVLVQLPIHVAASAMGSWLMYVQHQFDGVYRVRQDEWDYVAAALRGSSHYSLPAIPQWFSANIGFHHVHHLDPKIPNYNLQLCHEENRDVFTTTKTVTTRDCWRMVRRPLYDEERRALVSAPDLS